MTNVDTFYWNYFLTNIAMFTTTAVAALSFVASMVDACLSWVYGGFINNARPGRWGRYRSWLVMAPWIVPFVYACQFLKIGEGVVSYVVVLFSCIVSHVIWNVAYSANVTLISVIGKTPEDRSVLASSRATWNQIGGVGFSYLGLPLAAVLGGIIGEQNRFAALAFVLGLGMVAGYAVNFFATSGYEEIECPRNGARKESKTKASIDDMAKALFQNPHLCFLILGDFPKFVIKFVSTAAAIYYFQYVAQNLSLLTGYVLASNLCAVVGAFIAAFIAKKLSARNTVIITYLIMAAAAILSYFLYLNVAVVIVLMSIVQLGYGVCYACNSALYADTAVYAQWKSGVDSRGWIMGLQNFPLKFAVVSRALVLNISLIMVGFDASIDPAQATDSVKRGTAAAFSFIPGMFLIVGGIILFFGFRLTKEIVVKYQEEIDSRSG